MSTAGLTILVMSLVPLAAMTYALWRWIRFVLLAPRCPKCGASRVTVRLLGPDNAAQMSHDADYLCRSCGLAWASREHRGD